MSIGIDLDSLEENENGSLRFALGGLAGAHGQGGQGARGGRGAGVAPPPLPHADHPCATDWGLSLAGFKGSERRHVI
jgi:hypothetical protein